MDPQIYLHIGITCFLLGAALSLLSLPKVQHYLYFFSAAGSLAFIVLGIFLSIGFPLTTVPIPVSSFFAFVLWGDGLSGFFVIVISLLSCAVSLFSIGYLREGRSRGLMGFLFHLFILSMYAVVLSGNIFTFLIAWETMSVVSYFLVTFERDEKSSKAGLVYAVMTHIGTAFIIVLFFVLYAYTGHMDFSSMKMGSAGIPDGVKGLVFIFSLVGFGTKAGIIPLHTWLPRAHPAAPSNISSLMSGVMIKTGVYGFLRIVMDILGQGPEWWGVAVVVIGAVSSILGVLYALMEQDMKRLLAYSSVENVGIILLGIGASMIFRSNSLDSLSALALAAGLYHTVNHAVFKGLLFLGAGSVLHGTHTKDTEDLGGLIKTMPYTGLFFLIGSLSICALPPFNGFVSEWLTFQSLLLGFKVSSITSKIVSPLGGAALALTGALAAACFVKAFGISFLGMPRSDHSRNAKESSFSMIIGMGVLAFFCLLFGLFPAVVKGMIGPAVFCLTGSDIMGADFGLLRVRDTAASLSPGALLITMTVMFLAVVIFMAIAGGRRKIRYGDSWDCGLAELGPRMQYTATAFTKPIRVIFKRIYLPTREIKVSYMVKPFFVKSIRYSGEITPFFEKYFYDRVTSSVHALAGKVRMLQSGSLHLYLGYILVTLILLLVFGT